MGRVANNLESQREVVEGGCGELAIALVILDLVRERVIQSMRYAPKGLMEPALEDMITVEVSIVRAQQKFQLLGGFHADNLPEHNCNAH
jgi:hypothetical protein